MSPGERRALRIVLAYLAACLVAGTALFVESALLSFLFEPQAAPSFLDLITLLLAGIMVAPILAVAAVPPAAICIGIAEWFDLRGRFMHALGGAAALLFCGFGLGTITMVMDNFGRQVPQDAADQLARAMLLYVLPGLLAGLVYWRVRGEVPKAT